MVRQDIIAGIKNAVERGYSFEQAKKVLINSGYNINDINETYNYLTGGALSAENLPAFKTPNIPENTNLNQNYPSLPKTPEIKNKKTFPWTVVILSSILILLIICLILVFAFSDKIATFFSNTFGK